jgi:DNA-binding NtrC family response regulator
MHHEVADDVREALATMRVIASERSVLVIEPDPDLQQGVAGVLKRSGRLVVGTSTIDGGRSLLREFPVDLVLVAETLTLPNPMVVIADLVGLRPGARFVVMVEPEEPTSGVRPVRNNEAIEYVERPVDALLFRSVASG